MKFLDQPPHYLFFTGKGGVGKTSVACAASVQLADAGRRVLLVSTDPASNIGQVFGVEIGNSMVAIDSVPGLTALEIDPMAAAHAYRERIVGPVRGVLPEAVVKGIEEQLSGACTTEIAAFDEFTELLTDAELAVDYDHIVFDTAPTGHTIRLLQLPGAWSGFLEEGKGDASCLGPLAGLEKQRTQYKAAVDALSDPALTRLILVARGQAATLREAARTHAELSALGLRQQYLVINGVLPIEEGNTDRLARAIGDREQAALAAIPSTLEALPRDEISLKPFNLVGLPALRLLLVSDVPASASRSATTASERSCATAPSLATLVDGIAADGHGLVMLMGKGGVGKTTLAAAVAVELARRGLPVHLTTSDPAAHLTETLAGSLDHLTVSRIDPHAVTERYRQQVLETRGATLDAQGRALLEEDLRSPCTEEIAVFQAFSRIIREAAKKYVVMDTAPTGHTLLLLDATGAYHREITRQMSGRNFHFTTPLMQLQDSKQTKVMIVTLAETTPVLEAANLQTDLRRAGIEPWAWIINNSVAAVHVSSPLLRQRATNELAQIDAVATRHARRYAVVPLLEDEPVGVNRLQTLAGGNQGCEKAPAWLKRDAQGSTIETLQRE
ncbi:arsenical pump-driving ATPase [Accumulibacter sp.]|uniref:arsenical pump-driving ATPase n=1 Tax=Accumulibacter sp. TaxID=2053492 RepID=UPI001A384A3F|nr:arsenical pump-driving ATPase [Accumulibacter sp.]MBL8374937.1 arsenical pump-driving ATPase [Accumulibacter sp.]